MSSQKPRLIVAITGATGSIYGYRLLQRLRQQQDVEVHLILSAAAILNIQHELQLGKEDFIQLADVYHPVKDIGASIASGSYLTLGMIIAPCSMKTLAAIAHGYSDNLISRAADVTLKERKRLVLMVRETPLHLVHLRNMTTVTEMGAIVAPPLPAFYQHPKTIEELVDHSVERTLSLLQMATPKEWLGLTPSV